ncbi:unnamed protein product [Paramecium primaurelia]|uniref:Protein kinase domain-containing protein n=1 Tax=Paramecium primaurelia TaxID=5886 RepID=A0A8S1QNJ1_PARPR|nr:unnamed protein product [Paramecium primaurelia]
MSQQNQFNQIDVGTIISAPSGQYPNRQFKLSKLLGQGSEGNVYEAIPINWGQNQNKVALKFSTFIKDNVRYFYKQIIDYQNTYENYNSSNYQASNIIRIYDFFDYSFYFVLVMEIGDIDLYKYIEQNKITLSIQQKQSICLQILQSIVFLHKQKLVHRDIKPENYLVIDQQVKLIDFGLIKFFNEDEKRMTKSVGTKLFQAPELIEGKSDYTMSVDVWAMAFVFYEIISGSQLIDAKTTTELETQVKFHINNQTNIYNKIDRLMINDEWKLTIKSMLHPDPNYRISANDAQEKLTKQNILMNPKQNPFIIPTQQQIPQNFVKQTPLNGQSIQQISLIQQLNTLLMHLQQPANIIQFQQQKEQSIKLLSNIKDQIIKVQNQLENNPNFVLSTNSSDSSQETQKQNQQICKKEIPPSIKQKLDQQRKLIQEIEEKSISIQEELDLNENFQKITTELNYLTQITQNFELRDQEYKSTLKKVEDLRQKQKLFMKKEILEQNLKELQDQYKSSTEISLQKDIENNQIKILKLEQQINTISYLQTQKSKQQEKIEQLNQEITILQNLEYEVIKQKDEILELKVKHEYLKLIQNELEKNKQHIDSLKQEIARLQIFQSQSQQQQKQIQELEKEIKQLQDIEADVNKKKQEIIQMKAKLRELPNEREKQATYIQDIEKLKNELKNLETIQNNIESLNQQIKQLNQQKNLKLEMQEEETKLKQEKEQYEKEQKKFQTNTGRPSARNN